MIEKIFRSYPEFNRKKLKLSEKAERSMKIFEPVNKLWLDEFAFLEVGTLLRSSPKTIPIKVICFLNKE